MATSIKTRRAKLGFEALRRYAVRGNSVATVVCTAVLTASLGVLSGCMASTPSTFPNIPLPTSPSSGMPQSSQSSQPSGGGPPQPSSPSPSSSSPTGMPSLPMPGDPTPAPPSPPSLPSPNSGDPTAGLPQMPQLPSPEGGGEPGDASQTEGGQTGAETNTGGMDLPGGEGGPLQTGGEIDDGAEGGEDAQSGTDESAGNENLPGSEGDPSQTGGESEDAGQNSSEGGLTLPGSLPGDESQGESQDDDGWVISNELPTLEGGTIPGDEQVDAAQSNLPDDGTIGGSVEDEALERTLGDLDAEILDERNSEIEKANDRAVASGLPDLSDEGALAGAEGDDEPSGPATAPHQARVGEDAETGPVPTSVITAVDTPDARDEDVIARQLREAAMAEKDPELRASLWEEYERYTGKKK